MNQSFLQKSLLLSCILFLMSMMVMAQDHKIVDAQQEQSIIDFLLEDMDEGVVQFLAKEQLLSNMSWQDIMPFEDLKALLEQEESRKKKRVQSKMTLRTQYSDPFLLDIMNQEYTPIYTNITTQTNFSLKGIPLNINTNITAIDAAVKKDLSSVSIDFDLFSYLEKLRTKLLPSPTTLLEQLPEKSSFPLNNVAKPTQTIDNLKKLSRSEINILKSELKFQIYQFIVTDPRFVELATQTNKAKNQQEKIRESPIQKVRDQYQQQWERRKQYYGDSLRVVQHKVKEVTRKINEYNDPNKLRELILKKKKGSLLQRVLTASKKISIGQSIIEGDWYTAKSFPIQGFQYQYSASDFFGTLAIGKQRYHNQFLPTWGVGLFKQSPGASVLHLNTGYSFKEQHTIEYNFINIKDKGSSESGFIVAPQNNTVFTISGKSQVNKNLHLKATLGFSRNIWGQTDLASQTTIHSSNTVSEISMSHSFFKDTWQLELGYFFVGADFITRANPFLLNNQQGFLTKMQGQVGEKLNTSLEIKMGQTIDDKLFGGEQKRIQVLGDFHWRPLPKFTIAGQIAPNTFKHFGTGAVSLSNSNFLYNLQGNLALAIDQTQNYSSIGFTNHRTQLSFVDTSSTNHTNYVFLNHSIFLPTNWQFSALMMHGKAYSENTTSTSSFFQLDGTLQKTKCTTNLGVQYLKDIADPTWYYGVKGSFEWQIGKGFSLLVDSSLQWPNSSTNENKKRFWGSLMLSTKF